jgi:hypothetical protein
MVTAYSPEPSALMVNSSVVSKQEENKIRNPNPAQLSIFLRECFMFYRSDIDGYTSLIYDRKLQTG